MVLKIDNPLKLVLIDEKSMKEVYEDEIRNNLINNNYRVTIAFDNITMIGEKKLYIGDIFHNKKEDRIYVVGFNSTETNNSIHSIGFYVFNIDELFNSEYDLIFSNHYKEMIHFVDKKIIKEDFEYIGNLLVNKQNTFLFIYEKMKYFLSEEEILEKEDIIYFYDIFLNKFFKTNDAVFIFEPLDENDRELYENSIYNKTFSLRKYFEYETLKANDLYLLSQIIFNSNMYLLIEEKHHTILSRKNRLLNNNLSSWNLSIFFENKNNHFILHFNGKTLKSEILFINGTTDWKQIKDLEKFSIIPPYEINRYDELFLLYL